MTSCGDLAYALSKDVMNATQFLNKWIKQPIRLESLASESDAKAYHSWWGHRKSDLEVALKAG